MIKDLIHLNLILFDLAFFIKFFNNIKIVLKTSAKLDE